MVTIPEDLSHARKRIFPRVQGRIVDMLLRIATVGGKVWEKRTRGGLSLVRVTANIGSSVQICRLRSEGRSHRLVVDPAPPLTALHDLMTWSHWRGTQRAKPDRPSDRVVPPSP